MNPEDQMTLDYLYFRNFKILAVEIDRQGRLIRSLEALVRHLVQEARALYAHRFFMRLILHNTNYAKLKIK